MILIDPLNYCQYDDHPLMADIAPIDLRNLASKVKQAHKQPAAVLAFKAFSVLANQVERGMLKTQHTPCRRGCSVCCRTLPPLYHVEMVALAREIRNSTGLAKDLLLARSRAALDRIEDLRLAYNGYPQTGGEQGTDYMDAFGPSGGVCPLLTAEGACMFYTHRPLACRLWAVIGDEPCVVGESRHRVIAFPAQARLHSILRLSGTTPYSPCDAILKGCSGGK
jgi:Fe-S-cluster containining protein